MKRKKLLRFLDSIEGMQFKIREEGKHITATIQFARSSAIRELVRRCPDGIYYHVSAIMDRFEVFIEK